MSQDHEYVEVTLLCEGGDPIVLAARSYHYMLYLLAHKRLEDRELPEPEQGWVHMDALARMLATDKRTINVHIGRARRQLMKAGIRGSEGLVARRPGTGKLRLGVPEVAVSDL